MKRRLGEAPSQQRSNAAPAECKRDRRQGEGSTAASEGHDKENASDDAFLWTEQFHRHFASAIYEIGVANSSPAVIHENMMQRDNANITSERIKSKLQKYRNNKQKSKQTFLEEYDTFLQKASAIEMAAATNQNAMLPPSVVLEMMGNAQKQRPLVGGDVAAYLSYCVMKDEQRNKAARSAAVPADHCAAEELLPTKRHLKRGAMDYMEKFSGTGISFPQLTDQEKDTSLGVSITFVMGLFLSMTQHLVQERGDEEQPGDPDGSGHASIGEHEDGQGMDQTTNAADGKAPSAAVRRVRVRGADRVNAMQQGRPQEVAGDPPPLPRMVEEEDVAK